MCVCVLRACLCASETLSHLSGAEQSANDLSFRPCVFG